MASSRAVPADFEAVRATASGRVQGVGFRASVVDRAHALGVLGWVRNEADGTVLVHAEGPAEAARELVAFLREGPPGASVDEVDVRPVKVEGHEQFAVRGVSAGRFVVEEHPAAAGSGGDADASDSSDDAAAAGFVLRLEVDGVMRDWRVPKGPSMNPADKRFAIALDPQADESAGAAPAVWDAGTYEQGGRVPWPEAIDRGHAVFVLHGEKLRGGFALQRTRGSGPRSGWLLIKRRDTEAQAAPAR